MPFNTRAVSQIRTMVSKDLSNPCVAVVLSGSLVLLESRTYSVVFNMCKTVSILCSFKAPLQLSAVRPVIVLNVLKSSRE